jgi:hypothetical protein
MKAKLFSVAVVLVALAAPAQALASGGGGSGAAQAALQAATTAQAALGASVSNQNAVNANVPVSIAGGNVNAGSSSGTQNANSTATTTVANTANTDQNQTLDQNLGSSGCQAGCGGAGGFQAGIQDAQTQQLALGAAKSDQNAVNANVPVSIAGGNVNSGSSSATQNANSTATTNVTNNAKTDQGQQQNQNIGGSSCKLGCGGAGGFQAGAQKADTQQAAVGAAKSGQNAVNANVPVSIAGGNVNSGSSSATQNANSTATTDVSNDATTNQDQQLNQNIGGSSCVAGCGGAGGFQAGLQDASTKQFAVGAAVSDQNAVNANVPVSIAGGNVNSGSSSATQNANSTAATDVSNTAATDQNQQLGQNIGGKSCGCEGLETKDVSSGGCSAGCGGNGGFQLGVQKADTEQAALGLSASKQNAVNSNAPATTAGGNVNSGSSSATQNANSTATTDVSNDAMTDQGQTLNQNIGGSSCKLGCGGAGGFQTGLQDASTKQFAVGAAYSGQNAVNGNAPVAIAGGDANSGSSSATQNANSTATTGVSNNATTNQNQQLNQDIGKSCGCDVREKKGRHDGCYAGCGGNGGFQLGAQFAETGQFAAGVAASKQNAVNGNSPHSTAGGNINGGSSYGTQNAGSNAMTGVTNTAGTKQCQCMTQNLGASSY